LASAPESVRDKIRLPAILLAMHNDPVTEWRRLAEHYRGLGDEELLLLAHEFSDLTESAQQALRAELQTRGLGDPEKPAQPARDPALRRNAARFAQQPSGDLAGPNADEDEAGDADEDGPIEGPHDYTWKTLLCECQTQRHAWQLAEALRRAGLESWIEGPGQYSTVGDLDVTNPRVLVAADQLDQARMIASQPIPQDIVEESNEEPAEYAPPVCPGCGAADPVLEGADAVNVWHCEVCGRDWTEAVDSEGESSSGTPAETQPAGAPTTTKGRVSSFFGFGGS
jgi:hypothetical protein